MKVERLLFLSGSDTEVLCHVSVKGRGLYEDVVNVQVCSLTEFKTPNHTHKYCRVRNQQSCVAVDELETSLLQGVSAHTTTTVSWVF